MLHVLWKLATCTCTCMCIYMYQCTWAGGGELDKDDIDWLIIDEGNLRCYSSSLIHHQTNQYQHTRSHTILKNVRISHHLVLNTILSMKDEWELLLNEIILAQSWWQHCKHLASQTVNKTHLPHQSIKIQIMHAN